MSLTARSVVALARPLARVLAITLAACVVIGARAQAAGSGPASPSIERRLAELEARAKTWEASQEEVERLLGDIEALRGELESAGAGTTAGAAQLDERVRALEDRLAADEERLKGVRKDVDHALASLPDIHIGAELDLAYNYDFNQPADGELALRALERHDDNDFSIQHAKLGASGSILDTVEARVDVLFGRSAQYLSGLTHGNLGTEDVDVEQVYVSYRAPVGSGLTLTFGKVASRLGAEVIEPTANDMFSRSFLFTLGIPHTYTGLLATYSFLDGATDLELGVVNGWDAVEDGNAAKTVVGKASTRVSEVLDLALAGTWGAEQQDENGPKRGTVDLIVNLRPLDELSFLLDVLYGSEADVPFADDGVDGGEVRRDVTWVGFSGIARWDASENVSLALRGEVFDDADGARTGTAQTLWEITETLAYEVVDNLVARVEHRHDESTERVFGNHDSFSRSRDTASFDVSYRY